MESNKQNNQPVQKVEKEISLGQQNRQPAQEIKQESTLFAEPIFQVGNFTVTNSLITS